MVIQVLTITLIIIYTGVGHATSNNRQKRAYITYPEGTYMGLLYALAIPLDEKNKNVMFSYNFEANYYFEVNHTSIDRFAVTQDSKGRSGMSRKLLYHVIESKIEKHGFSGRACLLRAICEAAASQLNHNGVFGELLSIMLIPSASQPEDITADFQIAETDGRADKCVSYNKECDFSFLDVVSHIF